MPIYIIQKEIEARNLKEALKNEKKGEIVFIDEKKEEEDKKVGFKN